jgi:protein-S-isoprenylcysteine O-methyltransferase Ste14
MNESAIFNLLMGAWTVSEILILIVTRTRRGGGRVRDRGSLLILWPTIVLSITAGFWIGERYRHNMFVHAAWLMSVCLGLFVLGLAIRWAAIATLGRAFSANVAIRDSQTVHKTGLFALVRHPSYSGMMLIFVAIGLATRNWIGLGVVVVPTMAALLYRIHVEEAALVEAFGSEYVSYSKVTKRLIPGVY